jgi:hypothetical protein
MVLSFLQRPLDILSKGRFFYVMVFFNREIAYEKVNDAQNGSGMKGH